MQYPQTNGPVRSEDAPTSSEMVEETLIETLKTDVLGWFGRHQDMRCFLAVDPSRRSLTSGDNSEVASFGSLPRAEVVINHDAFPQAHRPYLLELDLSTQTGIDALLWSIHIAFEDRRPEFMAEGLGQRIGGWLASLATINEIALHWSRILLQRDNKGRACVLRFYDSRALALLWPLLSHAQRQTMLGPVRAWHVLDASARPRAHVASSDAQANFSLSAAQWQEVHRHGLVNRALALHAHACGRQPTPDEIEVVGAAAARVERYGLIDSDDQVAFMCHALAWHPQFDLHPKVSQLLASRAADEFYIGQIGRLLANEIDEIRQGSWHQHPNASASR